MTSCRVPADRQPLSEQECALVLGLYWLGWQAGKIHQHTLIGLSTIHRILDGEHRYNDRPIR